MYSHTLRWMALAAGVASAGQAMSASTVDLSTLSAKQQAGWVAAQARRNAVHPEYNYDIKPPVLKAVRVNDNVNAARSDAQAVVSLRAVDNLSGIQSASIELSSDAGQWASGSWSADFPSTSGKIDVAINMSSVSQNGIWRVTSVALADANGNAAYYGADQLAAMGNTQVLVRNAVGDTLAPSVVAGGVLLTPSVSRSQPPAGMLPGRAARVGLSLKLQDAGTAGISSAYAQYCKDGWDCIYLYGSVQPRGRTDVTLTLGGQISEWTSSGAYQLDSISVFDKSGNASSWYAWDTDLGQFVDNTTLTITD